MSAGVLRVVVQCIHRYTQGITRNTRFSAVKSGIPICPIGFRALKRQSPVYLYVR